MSFASVVLSAALLAHLPSISEDDHGTFEEAFALGLALLGLVATRRRRD